MRILILLFEGLPATVIQSTVFDYARRLMEQQDAAVDVISFASCGALYSNSALRLDEVRSTFDGRLDLVEAVKPGLPFSPRLNAQRLQSILDRRLHYDVIHARTDYSCAVASLVRTKAKVVWDCRGDSLAELDYRQTGFMGSLARPWKVANIRRNLNLAATRCDGAAFVTQALFVKSQATLDVKPSAVIPNAASEALFRFDPAVRREVRRELGAGLDMPVVIYSGGLSAYQRVEDMFSWFGAFLEVEPNALFLFLTPECDRARAMTPPSIPSDRVVYRTAQLSEVNGFLNAADLGIMLRHADGTNRAAFPTKFAEYALTGLPVVMTRACPDVVSAAEQLNAFVSASDLSPAWSKQDYDRTKAADKAVYLLGRSAQISRMMALYAEVIGFQ